MNSIGKLIVFEGPDGSGKSTQINLLASKLNRLKLKVRTVNNLDQLSSLDVLNMINDGIYVIAEQSLNESNNFKNLNFPPDFGIILDAPSLVLKNRIATRKQDVDLLSLEKLRAKYLIRANKMKYTVIYTTDDKNIVSNNIWRQIFPAIDEKDKYSTEPISILEILSRKSEIITKEPSLNFASTDNEDSISNHILIDEASSLIARKSMIINNIGHKEELLKDRDDKLKFYTPKKLSKDVIPVYRLMISELFNVYYEAKDILAKHLHQHSNETFQKLDKDQLFETLENILPVCTLFSVDFYTTNIQFDLILSKYLLDDQEESNKLGKSLIKKYNLDFKPLKNGIKTVNPKANKILKNIKNSGYSNDLSDIDLLYYFPKNELDIIPYILFESSDKSIKELKKIIETWTYEEKLKIYASFINNYLHLKKSNNILDIPSYTLELICTYSQLRYLYINDLLCSFESQEITPRFGYDIPDNIIEAGLEEKFEKCFDLSFKLFSKLQEVKEFKDSQYATLLGHKQRYSISINASKIFKISKLRLTKDINCSYIKVLTDIYQKVSEAHPILIETINKDIQAK